jgi:hypothetical protein
MLPEKFEIVYNGNKVDVHTFSIDKQTLFRVMLTGGSAPLVLGRATQNEGYKFWTSFPEGRQGLAEKIGPLIEQYYRANNK